MAKPTLSNKIGTADKLQSYAESVLVKITENASIFTDPNPTIEELEAGIETFKSSRTEARFRDMRQVALKSQHATALKQLLYNLSLYVERIAQGDPAVILAAGFIPSKDFNTPVGVAPKPVDLRAEVLHVGTRSINVRVKSWKPARFYQFEYRKVDEEADWTRVLSSRSKLFLTDLEYLKAYEFRVAYLGSDPSLISYSEIARCVVV